MPDVDLQQIAEFEEKIKLLTSKLDEAKAEVKEWSNSSAQLSQNAAEARAKTQGMGRGLGGALLGVKFRASQRREAARINASISKQVADKRGQITEGKRKSQALVQSIQAELKATKEQYKALSALVRSKKKSKSSSIDIATSSVELLKKLKEAYNLGLLTEQEYEEKRQKLVDGI